MGAVQFHQSKALSDWMKDEKWPTELPVRPCIGDLIYSNVKRKNGRALARISAVLFRDGQMIAVLDARLDDAAEAQNEYKALFEEHL
jgi:hypothetical protein